MLSHIPAVTRLSANVVRLLGCNPGFYTLQGTCTYLIGQESQPSRILLDTGEKDNHEYLNLLKGYLSENNLRISSVIVSHWHLDHMGGVPNLAKGLSLEGTKFFKMKHKEDIDFKFDYIDGETTLKECGVSLRLIPTPGHTEDHLMLYLEEENVIFSGDCLLGEGSSVFQNLGDYLNSLRLMLKFRPTTIYPGHGKVIEDPIERINEHIKHRLDREQMILDQLTPDKPLSSAEIVGLIYEGVPEQLYEACVYNVTNHMNQLVKDGRAKEAFIQEKKVYLRTATG